MPHADGQHNPRVSERGVSCKRKLRMKSLELGRYLHQSCTMIPIDLLARSLIRVRNYCDILIINSI